MRDSIKTASLLLATMAIEISSKFFALLEGLSLGLSIFVYLCFIFTQLPNFLNKQFDVRIFREDIVLRAGLVVVPSVIFATVILTAPGKFLPVVFPEDLFLGINAAFLVLFGFSVLIIYSLFVGQRLSRRRKPTILKLLRVIEDKDDLDIDTKYLGSGRIKRYTVLVQIGLLNAFICLIVFFFWFIMWIIDYAFLGFVTIWFGFELFRSLKNRRIGGLGLFSSKIDEIEHKELFWDTFLSNAASNTLQRASTFLTAVSIGFSCIFVAVSPRYPGLLLSWLLFCGWMILILTLRVSARTNIRISHLFNNKKGKPLYRELPLENLVILAISCCYFIFISYSLTSNLPNLGRIVPTTPFAPFTTAVKGGFLRIFSVILANILCIYSAAKFVRSSSRNLIEVSKREYLKDKAKLAWLCIIGGLLVGSAYTQASGPLMFLLGALILLCFDEDILLIRERISPWKYALVKFGSRSLVLLGAVLALNGFSQINNETKAFFQPLLLPFAVLLTACFVPYIISCYREQKKRIASSRED
jgi:hypothetical protein